MSWSCKECGSHKKSTHVSICQKCYAREWARKNMVKIRVSTANYREKNLEKRRAWAKAKRGIKLEGLCVVCKDSLAEVRHHEDYTKPVEVMLICKKCHKAIHQKNGELTPVRLVRSDADTSDSGDSSSGEQSPEAHQDRKGLCKNCGKAEENHLKYCWTNCEKFELEGEK